MITSYSLRDFYRTLGGRIVRRLVRERLEKICGSAHGLRVLGGGYAVPYLRAFKKDSERTLALMFPSQGIHRWPEDGANLTCLADETELPFETSSIDRIVLVHSLEFTGFLTPAFEEFWRVLKSSGRIVVIVPNRMGLWARADWTPFGHGRPYSAAQVEEFLRENRFVPEHSEKGLFIPPFKSQFLLRSAIWWERLGEKLFPGMGGLIFVEASKQIYAGAGRGTPARAGERVRKTVPDGLPEPV